MPGYDSCGASFSQFESGLQDRVQCEDVGFATSVDRYSPNPSTHQCFGTLLTYYGNGNLANPTSCFPPAFVSTTQNDRRSLHTGKEEGAGSAVPRRRADPLSKQSHHFWPHRSAMTVASFKQRGTMKAQLVGSVVMGNPMEKIMAITKIWMTLTIPISQFCPGPHQPFCSAW